VADVLVRHARREGEALIRQGSSRGSTPRRGGRGRPPPQRPSRWRRGRKRDL